jgi:CRISPR system Cascade subunit CasE
MAPEARTLHMVRMRLRLDRLVELGKRRRLPLRDVDTGYLVHCELRELFGEVAPQPFVLDGTAGRWVTVLGYATETADALRARADAFADPAVHATCEWDGFVSKPMPTAWTVDARLGFQLRACPVVRMASAGAHHRAGAEVDAFIARCWAVGDPKIPVDREAVYREWLAQHVARLGGAELRAVRVEAFKLERVVRRTHEEQRRASPVERPDVTFRGELAITDPEAFRSLLARGIGRHRAFGFGMLLLRPPGEDRSTTC